MEIKKRPFMIRAINLVCPFCRIYEVESQGCFSLAKTHVAISLALAALISIGIVLGSHFCLGSSIGRSIALGGAGFSATFLIGYVVQRCLFGIRDNGIYDEEYQETHRNGFTRQLKSKKVPEKSRQQTVSLLKSFEKNPYTQTIYLDHKTLLDFILNLDEGALNQLKSDSKVFYDPSNEMWIPSIRVFQELILNPITKKANKEELVLNLFVRELCSLFEKKNSLQEGRIIAQKWIEYFDVDTIKRIIEKITDADLKTILQQYTQENDIVFVRRNFAIQEFNRQFSEKNCGTFYFGTSQDDGGCFWHTVAQALTYQFGKTITEKTLRTQCAAYMKNLPKDNWVQRVLKEKYESELKEIEISSEEWHMQPQDERSSSPSWGQPKIHGKILAELYNVKIVLFDGELQCDERGDPVLYDGEYLQSDPTTITGESDSNLEGFDGQGAEIYLAGDGSHFFPIWKVE